MQKYYYIIHLYLSRIYGYYEYFKYIFKLHLGVKSICS